jgi:hypothetical protein
MAYPLTCYHNVVGPVADPTGWVGIICVSCDATLSPEFVKDYCKNYEFDVDYNIWVHKNVFRSERDCPYCPPQKGCNSPSPSRRLEAVGAHAVERFREEFGWNVSPGQTSKSSQTTESPTSEG